MKVTFHEARKLITCPQNAHEVLQRILAHESPEDQDKEHLWVFHLNTRNAVKSIHLVALGTLTSTLVHPREVFTTAIAERAASILVAHNHPSLDPEPSAEDTKVTQALVEAGKLLDIPVIDHVITAGETYYSFKEQCLI